LRLAFFLAGFFAGFFLGDALAEFFLTADFFFVAAFLAPPFFLGLAFFLAVFFFVVLFLADVDFRLGFASPNAASQPSLNAFVAPNRMSDTLAIPSQKIRNLKRTSASCPSMIPVCHPKVNGIIVGQGLL